MSIRRRIFVVGAPRSGTTLVQSLLAAHDTLTSFTESHVFSRHFGTIGHLPFAWLRRNPTDRLADFVTENGLDATCEPGASILDRFVKAVPPPPLRFVAAPSVARACLRLFDEVAALDDSDPTGWIEKTPMHLHCLPFLESMSDDVRTDFVHVIRDGLETVASLHKASQNWPQPYDLDTCAERWNADVARTRRRVGKPHDHFVFYETLTADPETVLARLVRDLDLDWQPEILDRFGTQSSRWITQDESWKAGTPRPIRPSRAAQSTLTEAQRARVRSRLDVRRYAALEMAVGGHRD